VVSVICAPHTFCVGAAERARAGKLRPVCRLDCRWNVQSAAGPVGASAALLQSLHSITSRDLNAACPAPLVQASELVPEKKYREAQSILQKLIAADSDNPALHYALGYLHQQQEDWDEAYDSYQTSRALMPGLSDIHSRLAYVLYRSDDGDGTIAEARTAPSASIPATPKRTASLDLVCMPTASMRRLSTPSSNRWLASLTAPTSTTIWESLCTTKATSMPQPPTVR
jgi:tetratricopeptide (TPR) repeat protein